MVRKDDPQFLAVVNKTLGDLYRSEDQRDLPALNR
jgi:hypothetical protein